MDDSRESEQGAELQREGANDRRRGEEAHETGSESNIALFIVRSGGDQPAGQPG